MHNMCTAKCETEGDTWHKKGHATSLSWQETPKRRPSPPGEVFRSFFSSFSRRRRHSLQFPANFGSVSANPTCRRRASTHRVDYIIFFSFSLLLLLLFVLILSFCWGFFSAALIAKSKAKAKVFLFFSRTSYLTWLRFHFVFMRFFFFLFNVFVVERVAIQNWATCLKINLI